MKQSSLLKYPSLSKALGIMLLIFVAGFILIEGSDMLKVILILVVTLVVFLYNLLPVSMTALCVMTSLMVFGLVTPEEGVSGFSNPATITILAMFVLSAGIQRTGILQSLGRILSNITGKSRPRQFMALSILVGPISGFINNTAVVAILLPMMFDFAKRGKTPISKLLIPLSFISMAGGTLTLIGTSTNILAVNIWESMGKEPLNLFSITKLGIPVLLITILFFMFVGRFLLPSRKKDVDDKRQQDRSKFFVEVVIPKNSELVGTTLKESRFISTYNADLIQIIRDEKPLSGKHESIELQEGDILVLLMDEQSIIKLDTDKTARLLLDFDHSRNNANHHKETKIVKILVRSPQIFSDRKQETEKWKRHGMHIIGIQRGRLKQSRLKHIVFSAGEILLVKASERQLKKIKKFQDVIVLEELEEQFLPQKRWVAIGIVLGVIIAAALNILPIMVAALLGMISMIFTGCLQTEDLYDSVDWNVIYLLAGLIPLGIAMQNSGLTEMMADMLVSNADFLPPLILLGAFYMITTLLTEMISNNASVVLLVPIAITVAEKLSLNPLAFVIAVMFAASTSFLTPIGYQTNTMVFTAGNYKFSDFFKVGLPLNILLMIVTTWLISVFWGL